MMKSWFGINKSKIGVVAVVIFLIVFCSIHLRLVSNTFYIDSSDSFHSTVEGYGDVPLHLTQISKFAFSSVFDTEDPIYWGSEMNYHFIFNLLRGWVLAATDSWSIAVTWPLYLLVVLCVCLVFGIYRFILKDNYLAILGLLVFYLGSGFAWIQAIATKKDFFLTNFDMVYPYQNVDFGAPLILCLIHQHTFIFGLTLFLIFMLSLIGIYKRASLIFIVISIITLGLLPLSHIHSFISAVAVLFVILILSILLKNLDYAKKLFAVGLGSFIVAIPAMLYLWQSSGESFIKFRLGWMVGSGIGAVNFPGSERSIFSLPYLDFIWVNFGVILPLFIVALISLFIYFKKQNSEQRRSSIFLLTFGICGLVLFSLVQLVQFQPWDNDNNKILVYFLFLASPIIVWFLANLFASKTIVKHIVLAVVVIVSILTGLLDLGGLLLVKNDDLPVIFNSDARKMAEYIRSNISEKDIVLTGSNHLNLVSSLAGRSVLVGYPGWLWTRGIKYGERLKLIEEFYRNPDKRAKIFASYPISYVLLDDSIRYDFKTEEKVLDNLYERAYVSGSYILYSIKNN